MKRAALIGAVAFLAVGVSETNGAVRPGATEIVPLTHNGQVYGSLSLPYQDWVNQSRVPTPRAKIEVREFYGTENPCRLFAGSAFACWWEADEIIAFNPTAPIPRFWFLHELGHAFASYYLPADEQSEWFANGYAECALRRQRKMKPRLRHRCEAIRSTYQLSTNSQLGR